MCVFAGVCISLSLSLSEMKIRAETYQYYMPFIIIEFSYFNEARNGKYSNLIPRFLSLSLSLSLSLTHTHTHTHSLTGARAHTHTHTHTQRRTFSATSMLHPSLCHRQRQTCTPYTHILARARARAHTHTHTHTHTHFIVVAVGVFSQVLGDRHLPSFMRVSTPDTGIMATYAIVCFRRMSTQGGPWLECSCYKSSEIN